MKQPEDVPDFDGPTTAEALEFLLDATNLLDGILDSTERGTIRRAAHLLKIDSPPRSRADEHIRETIRRARANAIKIRTDRL